MTKSLGNKQKGTLGYFYIQIYSQATKAFFINNLNYTKLLMTSLCYYTVINFVIHTNTLCVQ